MFNQNQIAFSENWNGKLSGGKFFTTIRMHNPKKYYKGNILEVKFSNNYFKVEVEDVITKELVDFTDHELATDTGYGKEEALKIFERMYPKINVKEKSWDYILLKRVSESDIKNKENDLFSSLEDLKHPDLQARERVLKRISEIASLGKVAFLDTETTGLDGEIIELSIMGLDGSVLFDQLIKPVKNFIDPGALETHKIGLDELQDKEYLYTYQDRLQDIFNEYFIMIYNSEFDLKILKNSFYWNSQLEGQPEIRINLEKINSECLMNLYAIYKGEKSTKSYHKTGFRTHKLTQACSDLGIDAESVVAHRALGDCWMTKELFLKMMKEESKWRLSYKKLMMLYWRTQ